MDPSPWTPRLLMLGTRPLAPHPEGSPASQGLSRWGWCARPPWQRQQGWGSHRLTEPGWGLASVLAVLYPMGNR